MNRFDPTIASLDHYSKYDGTIEFYGRIRALLKPHFVVVDLGAGRGAWYLDDKSSYRKSIRFIRDDVHQLIGCDVDKAVLNNESTHANKLIEGGRLPFEDESVDVVIADFVLEHISDVPSFYSEIDRVLRYGGFFCARTPHILNYVVFLARLIRNDSHVDVLKVLQPDRKAADVFPTAYKLNTLQALRRYWRPERWQDYSYTYTAEPQYYARSRVLYGIFCLLHKLLPESLTGNLFVFMRKKSARPLEMSSSVR